LDTEIPAEIGGQGLALPLVRFRCHRAVGTAGEQHRGSALCNIFSWGIINLLEEDIRLQQFLYARADDGPVRDTASLDRGKLARDISQLLVFLRYDGVA